MPQELIYWSDDTYTNAIGWVAIDSLYSGVASGGLFMHSDASVKEVSELARSMTYKNALQRPRIGGAKGGIRFNHLDPEAPNVLRRFLKAQKDLIKNVWSTGADLNTDNNFIHSVIRQDLGLASGFVSVGNMLGKLYDIGDRSDEFLDLINRRAADHFTLGECATGYSVATCVDELWPTSPTAIIQGWGNVGRSLGYFLGRQKIAEVVGIIEKDYSIFHESALDIDKLLEIRNNLLERPIFPLDEYLLAVEAEGYKVLRRGSQSGEEFLLLCLSTKGADIFCPCALRYVIDKRVCRTLIESTFKDKESGRVRIICGANNAFSDDKSVNLLERSGIMVLPEWVSNSGNSLLFNEALKYISAAKYLPEVLLSRIDERIRQFLLKVSEWGDAKLSLYDNCYSLIKRPKEYFNEDSINIKKDT